MSSLHFSIRCDGALTLRDSDPVLGGVRVGRSQAFA